MPRKRKVTAESTELLVKQPRKSARIKKQSSHLKGYLVPEVKYKQLPISAFCTINKNKNSEESVDLDPLKPGVNKLSAKNNESNRSELHTQSKSTGWCNIEKTDQTKSRNPPLNSTNSKSIINSNKSKGQKTTFKRNTSGSFDKYGVVLPNFEDVLEYQRTLEQDKLRIEHLTHQMSLPLEAVEVNLTEPKPPQVVLDCKHLTKEEIFKLFSANLKHIEGILHGTIYSKRHDQFRKQNYKDNFTVKDLRYNTSMITFSFEQKKQLLNCLRKQFGKEELCENDQYFFKVLLPELCLKIFMDVHNMSKEVAINYLDERPVDVIT